MRLALAILSACVQPAASPVAPSAASPARRPADCRRAAQQTTQWHLNRGWHCDQETGAWVKGQLVDRTPRPLTGAHAPATKGAP